MLSNLSSFVTLLLLLCECVCEFTKMWHKWWASLQANSSRHEIEEVEKKPTNCEKILVFCCHFWNIHGRREKKNGEKFVRQINILITEPWIRQRNLFRKTLSGENKIVIAIKLKNKASDWFWLFPHIFDYLWHLQYMAHSIWMSFFFRFRLFFKPNIRMDAKWAHESTVKMNEKLMVKKMKTKWSS